MRSITDGCHSLHSSRYQKTLSLRRLALNCRELRLMHENTLQIANVISFSGLLQLLKQHLESACCQCTETELISLFLQDARGMKMASSVWKEFYISPKRKSFQIPSSFTSCYSPFTCVQNTFSFYFNYFYNENEQLVVTVQNSITYNSVNRSICGRDVPWIHLENTEFGNLMLLIIRIYVSFIDLDPPSSGIF